MLMCLVQLWLGHCYMTSLFWCLSLGYLSSHQSKNQEKETKTSFIQTGNGLAWKYKREELVKTIVEIFIYYLCINISTMVIFYYLCILHFTAMNISEISYCLVKSFTPSKVSNHKNWVIKKKTKIKPTFKDLD